MKANPRKLTGRQQEWLTHLRRAEARKMPLAQYCRAQGLSVQSLYNARYELTLQERRSTASKPAPGSLGRQTHLSPFKWLQVRRYRRRPAGFT